MACKYHNNLSPTDSLLVDHKCVSDPLPEKLLATFSEHHEQVWFIEYAPNGLSMATASKSRTLLIWDL